MRPVLFAGSVLALLGLALTISPVHAQEPSVPGAKSAPYQRWWYPSQIPTGPLEEGNSPARPAPTGFLTLPFTGPHYVTSIFDHCSPNYVPDGLVCRWDGLVKRAGGFDEDGPPSQNWLFYDGHDGLDYGLYYENVLAAADGTVSYATWNQPGCVKCGFGLEARIDHGNGITTRYGHLSRLLVSRGQHVSRGQVIGISGNTGSSTGEHLHWGVYLTDGFIPVDPYGWSGSFSDPWPHDAGNLWLGGAPRYPAVDMPAVAVSVDAADTGVEVDWKAGPGGSYDVQVVEDNQLARSWLSGVGAGSAVFAGAPGHAYWFLVTYRNDLGWTESGSSPVIGLSSDQLP
ncbi:MAG TPA: M23 family metallopeptidase [Candidatus Dormibacteraeota bacterium]